MEQTIVESVLQLNVKDRMRLLNIIYHSLDRPDSVIDEKWYDEAEKRLAEYKAGKVKGIPSAHVLGKRE